MMESKIQATSFTARETQARYNIYKVRRFIKKPLAGNRRTMATTSLIFLFTVVDFW
jgi:hypothetical protein